LPEALSLNADALSLCPQVAFTDSSQAPHRLLPGERYLVSTH
jgi:hypothetical protein